MARVSDAGYVAGLASETRGTVGARDSSMRLLFCYSTTHQGIDIPRSPGWILCGGVAFDLESRNIVEEFLSAFDLHRASWVEIRWSLMKLLNQTHKSERANC